MPFIEVPNTAEVEVIYRQDGQRVENTLWVEFGAPPDAETLQGLADAVGAAWIANVMPLLSVDTTLLQVDATDMSSDSGAQATSTAGMPVLGSVTSAAAANNVSLAVSFRTARRGRNFRGRNYIPGLSSDAISVGPNTVNNTFVTAIVAAYNAVKTAIEGAGGTWVIASRYSGVEPITHKPIPRSTGVTEPVTSVLVVDNVVDSQRRRLPGRGR